MMEINYSNLGAVEREQSSKDFLLGSIGIPESIPETYLPEWSAEIEMQAKQPCCGACSGTELKNSQDSFNGSFPYLWKKIKSIDNFPVDSGTSMEYIFKSLDEFGVCSKDLLEVDTSTDIETFAKNTGITPEMDSDAAEHRISVYAFSWSPTFEEIKQTIYQHKGAILLLKIGSEFWTDKNGVSSWKESDILPLRTGEPIVSGHFVFAYGYTKDYIFFVNHWTDQWGKKGIGYFGPEYVNRVIEMGTAVDLNGYTFTRDLKIGMYGTDVGILQKYLREEGLFKVGITSYYGPITAKAVSDFQMKYKDEILTPLGLTEPTGYFGESSRKMMETLYNK